MREMIVWRNEGKRFQCRAAGVAIHQGRVLVHQEKGQSHWSLPGGRVEWGESIVDALRREMQEELYVEVTVERLGWIIENFFTFEGEAYHEIGFYYLMQLPGDTPFLDEAAPFSMAETHLLFRWVPISKLENEAFYPICLRKGIRELRDGVVHFIERENQIIQPC
jgi:ADP-ribose pyrophosphatase YjhB (NUDIX family)